MLVPAGVVVGVTLAATAPVVWAGFVNWDDPANILENHHVRGFGAERLAWMWSSRHLGVWEPAGWMLKAAVVSAAGLSSTAFHAVSWMLHAINALLVFELIRRMLPICTARPISELSCSVAAAGGALLFSVHPLRAECVAWASSQPYLLAAMFSFGAVLCYLRAEGGRARWRIASFALFIAALLSKPAAVALPAVLLLLDVYPLGRLGGGRGWLRTGVWLEKLAFALPAVLVALYVAAEPTTSLLPRREIPVLQRLGFAGEAVGTLLLKTVWPIGLSPFHPLPWRVGATTGAVVAIVAAVLVVAAALLAQRRAPLAAFASAWFVLMLLPTLGLVRHGDHLVADRYAYLAAAGLSPAASAALLRAGPIILRVGAAALLLLATLTWRQCSVWNNSESLWRHALAVDADNWLARNNLAAVLIQKGRLDEAGTHIDEALRLAPDYPDALIARGLIDERQGRTERAIASYRRAVELMPFHRAAVNLGAALQRVGRVDEAEEVYRKALEADPRQRDVRLNYAALCIEQGRVAEGQALLEALLREDPRDADARVNLGVALLSRGQARDALAQFEAALAVDVSHVRAMYHRGGALVELGRRDAAIEAFRACVESDAGHASARAELAVLLLDKGEVGEAISLLDEAHRLRPGDARIVNKLAWVLATTAVDSLRDPPRALQLATEVPRLLGRETAQSLDTLAAAHAAAGRFDDAVAIATRARDRALASGNTPLATAIERRLDGYGRGRAYREYPISPIRR